MEDSMLSGLRNTGGSMFASFGGEIEPDPSEMEKAAQAALYNKQVKFKEVYVRTFDLGLPKDRKDYPKVLNDLYNGIQAKTHVLWYNDRRFVEDKDNPRWVIHMEWAEFELAIKANPTLGSEESENA